jgi:hypothetical protein
MSVKLKTASNGSVTLAPEDTASDVTLTVPAGTSSLVSNTTLRTELNATGSAPIFACRAWVNFNGTGTVAIRGSGNVSSITDNGTGRYTVNFTTAMEDVNYAVSLSNGDIDATNRVASVDEYSSSYVSVLTYNTANDLRDREYIHVAIFR